MSIPAGDNIGVTGRGIRTRVWSLPVRVVHWCLALAVILAWITHEGPPWLHDWLGYAALAIAVLRTGTGVVGPKGQRFAGFVRGPVTTLSYARTVISGSESRFLGHNPLGGWMIVMLLLVTVGAGFTGWLYTTKAYWGVQWVNDLHGGLADLLLFLVLLHVAGVVFTSFRQSENLAGAMVHGRKPLRTRRHPEPPEDLEELTGTGGDPDTGGAGDSATRR